jgi:hypothetical protein
MHVFGRAHQALVTPDDQEAAQMIERQVIQVQRV